MQNIVVLGSINMDLVVLAERAPQAGETLTGSQFLTAPGGKGANQAVATARMGSQVGFIGRVGADGFGGELKGKLAENGIDVDHVLQDKDTTTGVALIIVEAGGENRIVIIPAANGRISASDVDQAQPLLKGAQALVTQLEIPLDTVTYGIQQAKILGLKVALNPAPAKPLPEALLKQVDFLILNETETQLLTGSAVEDVPSARRAGNIMHGITGGEVILTLGSKGSVAVGAQGAWFVPAYQVQAVDTTAAGDAFIGAFISAYEGSLPEAVLVGNAAGALACTKLGAQPSLPSAAEVKAFMEKERSSISIQAL